MMRMCKTCKPGCCCFGKAVWGWGSRILLPPQRAPGVEDGGGGDVRRGFDGWA